MDLSNPHPSLAATIKHVGAEGKTHLLPTALWEFLELVNSKSPHYNNRNAQSLKQGVEALMRQFYMDAAGQDLHPQVSVQQLSAIYNDFSKGMMYTAKHFEKNGEGSDVHKIAILGVTDPPPGALHAYGFATDNGLTVGMYPRLISMCISQDNLRSSKELPGQGRIYEDHKIPGKYFNAQEMTILTGIEEACHAQQMLKGRFRQEYQITPGMDETAYVNAACEKEAEAVQQAAVVELGLGANTPDPEEFEPDRPKTPKERAEERKKARHQQKRHR